MEPDCLLAINGTCGTFAPMLTEMMQSVAGASAPAATDLVVDMPSMLVRTTKVYKLNDADEQHDNWSLAANFDKQRPE